MRPPYEEAESQMWTPPRRPPVTPHTSWWRRTLAVLRDPPRPDLLSCGCPRADHRAVACPDQCGYVTCHTHRDRLDQHICTERSAI